MNVESYAIGFAMPCLGDEIMIQITKKEECCGCSACYASCPVNAISMISDNEGFLYPKVDSAICIQCGRCETVCLFRTNEPFSERIPAAYIAVNNSEEILRHSTSGGLFTALSDLVLKQGGTVYGAVYDEKINVFHMRAEMEVERDRMRGSKYVQSDMKDCFREVKRDILNKRTVLFSGTPCQVEGLYSYLGGIDTSGLITCDLICFGASSPRVFQEHIKLLECKYRSRIISYECRPAQHGHAWGCATELAVTEKGKVIHSTPWIALKRKIFYANLDKRPACYNCKYCGINRPGDFSIGDCRMAPEIVPQETFFDGVSTLLVNTTKGKMYLSELSKEVKMWETTIDKILQAPLIAPSPAPYKRELFWSTLNKRGYLAAISACFGKYSILKSQIKKVIRFFE